MALPTDTVSPRTSSLGFPTRPFSSSSTDYELYEDDGEFVLAIELPGFDADELSLAWDDGVLNVAADREDDGRDGRRRYRRRFRFPKDVDVEEIDAEYTNGVLEVRLPIRTGEAAGTEIEIDG